MSKKFVTIPANSSENFKTPDIEPHIDHDTLKPIFSFHYMSYGSKTCLSKCDKQSKAFIVSKLLKLSQFTWERIKSEPRDKLGFEEISREQFKVPIPKIRTPEVPLLVFRFSDTGRMAGFRDKDIYHIIAVGPHHNLY